MGETNFTLTLQFQVPFVNNSHQMSEFFCCCKGEARGQAGGPEGCQQAVDQQQQLRQLRPDQPGAAGPHRNQGKLHLKIFS